LILADQFDPIPEWIVNMAAPHARNVVRFMNLNSRSPQALNQAVVIGALQRWVRLLRRAKIAFHSEMHLHSPALEPAPSALGELARLRNFAHPEQIAVKLSRLIFAAYRHSKLNVIDS
jgi:hypothetical protein